MIHLCSQKEEILLTNQLPDCIFYPATLQEMLHLESRVNEMPLHKIPAS